MLIRICILIMSRSFPGHRVRRRMGSSCSDGHVAVVFFYDFVVVAVVNVGFALLLLSLLLSLLSSFSWLFTVTYLLHRHNCVIRPISNDSICELTHSPVIRNHQTPPTHPFFFAPRILIYRKTGFLYLNRQYFRIFHHFLPVVQSNINRFSNGFLFRIAFSKLYNIAVQSLSRHKLRCIKIIIETFLRHIRFPCVSSVVFEAITISISRHVFSRRTEQFDTTRNILGQKLTILENCIFRSARIRFRKRRLF